jgi:hypothetical protein
MKKNIKILKFFKNEQIIRNFKNTERRKDLIYFFFLLKIFFLENSD